jgi:hypothetical protein
MSYEKRWPSSPEWERWAYELERKIKRMAFDEQVARLKELLEELGNPLLGRAGQVWCGEVFHLSAEIRNAVRLREKDRS